MDKISTAAEAMSNVKNGSLVAANFWGPGSPLYLWRAPDEIIFDRSGQFKALYQPQNLEETIVEAFYERSGRPLLGITRLVEEGTAANPPK